MRRVSCFLIFNVLTPSRSLHTAVDTEDTAEVEATWDAEIDGRIKNIEEDKVKLVSSEEFERNTAVLFGELGIPT